MGNCFGCGRGCACRNCFGCGRGCTTDKARAQLNGKGSRETPPDEARAQLNGKGSRETPPDEARAQLNREEPPETPPDEVGAQLNGEGTRETPPDEAGAQLNGNGPPETSPDEARARLKGKGTLEPSDEARARLKGKGTPEPSDETRARLKGKGIQETYLDDVRAQLGRLNNVNDQFFIIVKEFLQRRKAKEPVKGNKNALLLIGTGEKFCKFLDNHADVEEKSSKKEDIVNSPSLVGGVLERLGNVHWSMAVLSVIGFILHTAHEMKENYDRCIDLLQRLVNLLDHVEKLDNRIQDGDGKENLKTAAGLIVRGCILCASQLSSHKFFRFLKASEFAEKLNKLSEEIGHVQRDLMLTILLQGPARKQTDMKRNLSWSDLEESFGECKPEEYLQFSLRRTKSSSEITLKYMQTTDKGQIKANLNLKHVNKMLKMAANSKQHVTSEDGDEDLR